MRRGRKRAHPESPGWTESRLVDCPCCGAHVHRLLINDHLESGCSGQVALLSKMPYLTAPHCTPPHRTPPHHTTPQSPYPSPPTPTHPTQPYPPTHPTPQLAQSSLPNPTQPNQSKPKQVNRTRPTPTLLHPTPPSSISLYPRLLALSPLHQRRAAVLLAHHTFLVNWRQPRGSFRLKVARGVSNHQGTANSWGMRQSSCYRMRMAIPVDPAAMEHSLLAATKGSLTNSL